MKTEMFQAIDQALKGMQVGSIQGIVHGGELVRIERLEKIQLQHNKTKENSQSTGPPGDSKDNPQRPT